MSPDLKGVLQTIDSAVQEYKNLEDHDVVLLGSSLIMSPLWMADAHRLHNADDFFRHHRSYELEERLLKALHRPARVFSFAVPGATVSDMDLIADKVLLVGAKKPSMIVYGLAPRDFMYDVGSGATRTPVFQRLGDLTDLSRVKFGATSMDEKLDVIYNRAIFLFDKRSRYQAKTTLFLQNLIVKDKQKRTLPANVGSSSDPCPLLRDRNVSWTKTANEYRMRYQNFNQTQFKKQVQFLEDLLSNCTQNDIKVVLINMPLTETNRALMPNGLYEKYMNMLQTVSTANNATLVDLATDKYGDECFCDTVHLNALGAKLFLTSLSQAICNEQTNRKIARHSDGNL